MVVRIAGAVFNPILQTLSAGNIAGEHHIICQQFQDLFATFGGAGSTLSLVIAMLLFCKSKRITNLGKLSFVPGIFGINEPIVFGLPIVLNPTLLIPFVLVPTVNIVISYFAMAMNLVPIVLELIFLGQHQLLFLVSLQQIGQELFYKCCY